jgi:type I restriction enzyme S subunit
MSSKEKVYTLEEVTTLVTDGKHGDCQDLAGSGYYFLSVKDIKGDRLNYEQARQITQKDFEETHKRTNLEPGDILFTNTGTIGRMAIATSNELTRRTTFQKSVAILKPKANIVTSRYLFYLLKAENRRLSAFAEGTTQKNLLLKDFRSFEIGELPPIEDQKAIAHILGTLDDKIELNRKTNETLEAMAKALFKSWFVDFDPVRAKAEGRPTGLPEEISDLFPDSFEEAELGEIPRGWRDGEIQDVAELNPETWDSKNQPSRVRYLDLSNVKYGKIDCIEEYEWEFAPSRAKRVLKTGDTVLGTVRPGNGSYCLIGEDGITGSTGFAVLRPKNKNDDVFVYLGSCSKENIDRLAHLADGGAYPAVRPELIAKTPVAVATREVLDCFSIRVSPLFAASEKGRRESKVLCQVRDTLLPKLISGELRIPDAEKLLVQGGV